MQTFLTVCSDSETTPCLVKDRDHKLLSEKHFFIIIIKLISQFHVVTTAIISRCYPGNRHQAHKNNKGKKRNNNMNGSDLRDEHRPSPAFQPSKLRPERMSLTLAMKTVNEHYENEKMKVLWKVQRHYEQRGYESISSHIVLARVWLDGWRRNSDWRRNPRKNLWEDAQRVINDYFDEKKRIFCAFQSIVVMRTMPRRIARSSKRRVGRSIVHHG